MLKTKSPKNYYLATAVMLGYIIGVGMFGLPWVVSRAGVLTFGFFIISLGLVQYLLHLIYAHVILVTKTYHRLPGYAGVYLGKKGRALVFVAKLLGNYSALLAYIIITGIFLNQLLGPYLGGSEFLYASALFLIEAAIVYFGIKMIARAELVMTGALFLVVGLIIWQGRNFIEAGNYVVLDWKYFLLPYGATLFALDGGGALPIVAKLLNRRPEAMKSVIRLCAWLSVATIAIFTLVIVGISGSRTSPDALAGVKLILNDGVVFFSLIFGVLTMITSFLGVAEAVRETLWWDFKLNKNLAWAIAVFIPYFLYLLNIKNLIWIISFAGAVAGGLSGIFLILIFKKSGAKESPLFKRRLPDLITGLLVGLFGCGILYEIYYLLIK